MPFYRKCIWILSSCTMKYLLKIACGKHVPLKADILPWSLGLWVWLQHVLMKLMKRFTKSTQLKSIIQRNDVCFLLLKQVDQCLLFLAWDEISTEHSKKLHSEAFCFMLISIHLIIKMRNFNHSTNI